MAYDHDGDDVLTREVADYLEDAAVDADRSGAFPAGHFSILRKNGLLSPGEGVEAQNRRIACLAEICPSTAFVVHMHQAVHHFVSALGSSRIIAAITGPSAPLMCSANSEPGMHYKRVAVRSTTIERVSDDRVKIRGRKHFCSGVEHADYIFCTAVDAETGGPAVAVFEKERPGVRIVGEWDSLGLRATGSRSLELDVSVPAAFVVPLEKPLAAEYWSLGYAAIAYGIGRATLRGLVGAYDSLTASGRWGEDELTRLGSLVHAARAAAALLDQAVRAYGGPSGRAAVLSARIAASDFAGHACAFGMEAIGGESVGFRSPWSRRRRDHETVDLLPPSTGRRLRLLGLHELGEDRPLLEVIGRVPPGDEDVDPLKPGESVGL